MSVQYALPRRGVPAAASLARWARAARPGMPLTLRVVGEREGRRLNRSFRKKNRATNVLSFPLPGEGDIVLCHPVIRREARAQRKPLAAHYAHLVVHGVLHLRGLRHGRAMERREARILRGFGVADPYILDR
ncbi:MAG TPA: rRNA maturation RNase YbeY [Burkholderiales bacterium]|nr:rRNA maturation RNase YbeY [Burkholderiales bacterium]